MISSFLTLYFARTYEQHCRGELPYAALQADEDAEQEDSEGQQEGAGASQ